MDRLSGKTKPKEVAPNLLKYMAMVNKRIESIDMKIAELDEILVNYKDHLEEMREDPARICIEIAESSVQKRKKLYEMEKDRLADQSFRLEKIKSLVQRFNAITDAMNMTVKELKRLSRKVKTNENDTE
ncbi:charged multivesicular body protein 5-like, partial [Stegodyphus dumicola]|uniref:charged multivesicular body protein 5-like n=1 Tax=Stegodyphus dumicola TaxID=202533 RepID=UPI0015A7B092